MHVDALWTLFDPSPWPGGDQKTQLLGLVASGDAPRAKFGNPYQWFKHLTFFSPVHALHILVNLHSFIFIPNLFINLFYVFTGFCRRVFHWTVSLTSNGKPRPCEHYFCSLQLGFTLVRLSQSPLTSPHITSHLSHL